MIPPSSSSPRAQPASPLHADPLGAEVQPNETLLITGALQRAILNSANFSSIATDEKGVIQLFNVGAECMLGYMAAEVLNKITPAGNFRSAGGHCPRRGAEPGVGHDDCPRF